MQRRNRNIYEGGKNITVAIVTAVAKGEISVLVNVAGVAPKVRRDILEMTEERYAMSSLM